MKKCSVLLLSAAMICLLCACKQEHPAPPTGSTELMVRFFDSMRKGDSESAVAQGEKLQLLDQSHDFAAQLVAIQQSNRFVALAQKSLNEYDLPQAVKALEDGMAAYPNNRSLSQMSRRTKQLRNAERLFRAMRTAQNPDAMSAALTAAKIGLSSNQSPVLNRYFNAYSKRIAKLREQESAREE